MSADSTNSHSQIPDARKRAALLEYQRRVLERIATGAPLEEVLHTLVSLIEEQASDMRCAVLLADAGQTRLRFVAAPSIPEDFKANMQPYLAIAPNMGSCGTAAYLKQPVYSRDTASDQLWDNFGDIAVRYSLRAVWSTPILSDENRVLGTFAMYYGEPRLPGEEHIQLIDMAVQMARVAIEAKADDDILRTVFDNSPAGLMITDLAGTIVRVNQAFARDLGYSPNDLSGKPIAEIASTVEHDELVQRLIANESEVSSRRRYRTDHGKLLWARERSALRPDPASGEPRYIFTQVDELSEAFHDPLERLSPRERQVLELVVSGRTSKEIAERLRISAGSVDTYRSRIMFKLDIGDLPGLVRFAIRQGIAPV